MEETLHTIMLVEDNQDMGRLMRFLFELEGYRVVTTDDYDNVLPLLCQAHPDAVLMDVQVQGRETINLVHQIRQLGEWATRIPIVMTSAMDYRHRCLEAGADQFVLKPFLPDEVVQDITDISNQEFSMLSSVPVGVGFNP
jgi:CheY-like chemotaxis protein